MITEGSPARYERRDTSGRRVRHVFVMRTSDESFAHDSTTIDQFVMAAERPLIEAILIAHELGHVQLDRERGDVAGDQEANKADRVARSLRGSDESVTLESVSAYYAEEENAWEIGKKILQTHGLEKSEAFEERRRDNLKTYENAIRTRFPDWHPTTGRK